MPLKLEAPVTSSSAIKDLANVERDQSDIRAFAIVLDGLIGRDRATKHVVESQISSCARAIENSYRAVRPWLADGDVVTGIDLDNDTCLIPVARGG